ncbi:unnamed protein product [Vitrella brassicaformis CCMP3155]|uniref:Uncharacterized protein n=3 Tax=Vitrella brassicaformis TaxID=1169539 RepID=A0A0G4F4I6_VITBC|nr:unnamed protein product [Vitrella brassicaformis CCMP3155]|eukprot:CEM06805.1 unnamed protein product [Vitrella brassicaformis CCMP3155]
MSSPSTISGLSAHRPSHQAALAAYRESRTPWDDNEGRRRRDVDERERRELQRLTRALKEQLKERSHVEREAHQAARQQDQRIAELSERNFRISRVASSYKSRLEAAEKENKKHCDDTSKLICELELMSHRLREAEANQIDRNALEAIQEELARTSHLLVTTEKSLHQRDKELQAELARSAQLEKELEEVRAMLPTHRSTRTRIGAPRAKSTGGRAQAVPITGDGQESVGSVGVRSTEGDDLDRLRCSIHYKDDRLRALRKERDRLQMDFESEHTRRTKAEEELASMWQRQQAFRKARTQLEHKNQANLQTIGQLQEALKAKNREVEQLQSALEKLTSPDSRLSSSRALPPPKPLAPPSPLAAHEREQEATHPEAEGEGERSPSMDMGRPSSPPPRSRPSVEELPSPMLTLESDKRGGGVPPAPLPDAQQKGTLPDVPQTPPSTSRRGLHPPGASSVSPSQLQRERTGDTPRVQLPEPPGPAEGEGRVDGRAPSPQTPPAAVAPGAAGAAVSCVDSGGDYGTELDWSVSSMSASPCRHSPTEAMVAPLAAGSSENADALHVGDLAEVTHEKDKGDTGLDSGDSGANAPTEEQADEEEEDMEAILKQQQLMAYELRTIAAKIIQRHFRHAKYRRRIAYLRTLARSSMAHHPSTQPPYAMIQKPPAAVKAAPRPPRHPGRKTIPDVVQEASTPPRLPRGAQREDGREDAGSEQEQSPPPCIWRPPVPVPLIEKPSSDGPCHPSMIPRPRGVSGGVCEGQRGEKRGLTTDSVSPRDEVSVGEQQSPSKGALLDEQDTTYPSPQEPTDHYLLPQPPAASDSPVSPASLYLRDDGLALPWSGREGPPPSPVKEIFGNEAAPTTAVAGVAVSGRVEGKAALN